MTARTIREAAPVPRPPVVMRPFFRTTCVCGRTYIAGVPDPVLLASWRAAHVGHTAHDALPHAAKLGGVAQRGTDATNEAHSATGFVPTGQNGATP